MGQRWHWLIVEIGKEIQFGTRGGHSSPCGPKFDASACPSNDSNDLDNLNHLQFHLRCSFAMAMYAILDCRY